MTYALVALWVLSAVIVIFSNIGTNRLIIYFGAFSLLTAACFLFFSAPDVALAQIVVGVFTTIIFLVALERHYSLPAAKREEKDPTRNIFKKYILPGAFATFLTLLVIYFLPESVDEFALREAYLTLFYTDIGGENAVTAIYLGYRVYDTLIEALMLLVCVVAIIQLSHHKKISVEEGRPSEVQDSAIASITIRIICPLILLVSIFISVNGHISPGGGFQGGVIAASFFVCRYMIYKIYDIRIKKVIDVEKIAFGIILLLVTFYVFANITQVGIFQIPQTVYLVAMNLLIALKVACGFLIIFYRFVAMERE